ncbi:hypothetical protein [Roseibium sp.]|uniref:hypothetical protein n=1 Tax=Roseibium sp. TaxID=1936156 RepID=UPI003BAE9804
MSLSDLPDPEDREAVIAFARSFRGYQVFGSFRACADAAFARRRETLADIRNELFFEQRSGNHAGGSQSTIALYQELLPYFRQFLSDDADLA